MEQTTTIPSEIETLRLFFKEFQPLDGKGLDDFDFQTLSYWNINPPTYLISLMFNTLGFTKYKGIEKIDWLTFFNYKGFIFQIHDYKFNTWTIAAHKNDIENNSEQLSGLVEEIKRKLIKGTKYLDKQLQEYLRLEIKKGDFYFNNVFRKLNNFYIFYDKQLGKTYSRREKAEMKVKRQKHKTQFGEVISTQFFDNKGKKEQEASYYFFPFSSIFFSLLEFILDTFAVFENPEINFINFRGMNWQDRFKSVFDINNSKIKEFYDGFLELKETYRNPLTHGLNNEVNFLIPIPNEGLVPISYEFLSSKPHFSHISISFEDCKRFHLLIKSFFKFLDKTKPYTFYLSFLKADFPIPKIKEDIDVIKHYMTSKKYFAEYIQQRLEYEDMVTNREI